MAYCLHIEREKQPISLAEWMAVARVTEGARLKEGDSVIMNPATGEQTRIKGSEGDVEVFFPSNSNQTVTQDEGNWQSAISFVRGSGRFRADGAIDNPNDPVRSVAVRLAAALNARIVGDEGEVCEW
jgi:hypothetical protein